MPHAKTRRKYPAAAQELAKALWMSAVRTSTIAEKTHVPAEIIRGWASRYQWNNLATETRKAMEQGLFKSVAEQVAEEGAALRRQMSRDLLQQSQRLPRPRRDLDGFSRRTAAVKSFVDTAATVYGWSAGQNTPQVNIALLSTNPDASAQTIQVEQPKPQGALPPPEESNAS